MAYATTDDLQARWGVLSDRQEAQAETLLGDVTAKIRQRFKLTETQESDNEELLRSITCAVVARALPDYGAVFSLQPDPSSFAAWGEQRTLGSIDLTYDEVNSIRAATSRSILWAVPF